MAGRGISAEKLAAYTFLPWVQHGVGRAIVRCDPPPGTSRFEAGYLPQVQFARADLPWLFTPGAPGTATP